MHECDEIAETMLRAYWHWIEGTPRGNCMAAAREYVRLLMPDYSEVMIDNVAESLYRRAA